MNLSSLNIFRAERIRLTSLAAILTLSFPEKLKQAQSGVSNHVSFGQDEIYLLFVVPLHEAAEVIIQEVRCLKRAGPDALV